MQIHSSGSAASSVAAPRAAHIVGLSDEMRRFVAGIRVITAILSSVLLLSRPGELGAMTALVLLFYCAWSAVVLLLDATVAELWHYWVDVAWSCVMLQLVSVGTGMLVLTLVNPIVIVSIGYSVRHGLLVALVAAAGIALDHNNFLMQDLARGWAQRWPALLVLALVPMTALFARPLHLLRKRMAAIVELQLQLDPRRGLAPLCAEIADRLRLATEADVFALVLPSVQGMPATISSRDDGSFRAKHEVHAVLEALLAKVGEQALSYAPSAWWDPRPSVRRLGPEPAPSGLGEQLAELAATFDSASVHVVPLSRYGRRHGHFVVGYSDARWRRSDLLALASTGPELLTFIEQATLVDQLQDESAAHERARIGRDLHDSAIQPYLGLKYAVESVALRIGRDNPVRADIDSLADLVNGEVSALRELISGLRTGATQGDNALVPAVRRQVKRFALLFGIDVEVDCPDMLPTSRAAASALFHMVNEALNNIRKHSGARRVWITLSIRDDKFRLVVRDDGGTVRGRPVEEFRPTSLSERAAEMNGRLTLSLPDGLNSEMMIEIPL